MDEEKPCQRLPFYHFHLIVLLPPLARPFSAIRAREEQHFGNGAGESGRQQGLDGGERGEP